jgi:hypothetical protein
VAGRGTERLPKVSRRAAMKAAARVLGVPAVQVVGELGGGSRTVVWRVRSGGATYVVKAYRSEEGNTFAREPAALAALDGTVTPRLVGVADDPPLVVLEDLGDFPSLAEAVLGRDRPRAQAALDGWVDAVAALHNADGPGVRSAFEDGLRSRAPRQAPQAMPEALADAVATYERHARRLGVEFPDSAAADLLGLADEFRHDSDVLTLADLCPDNNAVLDDRVVLFDAEWAEVRHRAWDAAYLRTPWPTCWCAWRLPAEVAEGAVERYRDRVTPTAPYVGTGGFLRDLDHAAFAWCLVTTAMFLESALGRSRTNHGDDRFPGRRTIILDRLGHATELPGPEPLVRFAADLHRALLGAWGDRPLALAPAFR